jgi:hypothetical protein
MVSDLLTSSWASSRLAWYPIAFRARPFIASVSPWFGNLLRTRSADLTAFLYCLLSYCLTTARNRSASFLGRGRPAPCWGSLLPGAGAAVPSWWWSDILCGKQARGSKVRRRNKL